MPAHHPSLLPQDPRDFTLRKRTRKTKAKPYPPTSPVRGSPQLLNDVIISNSIFILHFGPKIIRGKEEEHQCHKKILVTRIKHRSFWVSTVMSASNLLSVSHALGIYSQRTNGKSGVWKSTPPTKIDQVPPPPRRPLACDSSPLVPALFALPVFDSVRTRKSLTLCSLLFNLTLSYANPPLSPSLPRSLLVS